MLTTNPLKTIFFYCPGRCGSVGRVVFCKPKDHGRDSWLGHRPGRLVQSLVRRVQGQLINVLLSHQCFSPSPPPLLFLKSILKNLKFFIEFIRVRSVNKVIWMSSVQFYNTSSVYCIVCLPPQVKSPFFHYLSSIYLLSPASHSSL